MFQDEDYDTELLMWQKTNVSNLGGNRLINCVEACVIAFQDHGSSQWKFKDTQPQARLNVIVQPRPGTSRFTHPFLVAM